VPQKADWEGARGPEKGASPHSVGKFVLSLPRRFALIGKDEGALLFENAATKTEIKVVSGLQGDQLTPKSLLIRHVTGIGSYFDVLDSAYSARFGVFPLMLKGVVLGGLTDVRIYEIRQPLNRKIANGTMHGKDAFVNTQPPGLKGFITQGKKKETEVTYILLTDPDQRSELNIFISGALRLDETDIRKIVAAVNILPVR